MICKSFTNASIKISLNVQKRIKNKQTKYFYTGLRDLKPAQNTVNVGSSISWVLWRKINIYVKLCKIFVTCDYLVSWLILAMQLKEQRGSEVGRRHLSSSRQSSSLRQCAVWLLGPFHAGDTDRSEEWKHSSAHELLSENRFSATRDKVYCQLILKQELLSALVITKCQFTATLE